MIYLDTSVLVAYYLPEALSTLAQQRLLTASSVIVSELAQTEFVAALSLRQRIGDLSLVDVMQVTALFTNHLASGLYVPLHLDSAVYRQAHTYIVRYDLPLKAPDALHLAAAALEQALLVTADQQLARNAQTLAIDVELLATL
ncbi:MAG: type II toxin-antitoxin system VapC family toxin [Caldilinea sp.]|uniref:type II toxin-antitoxin system VapC family toxin n=1 Tax=Caldilinea sp. TaxID=2293560 RepID=UPI002B899736|nr:type II toxin-antitoxin system VapC family toxin [Anaerolineales bacterium]HQY92242.1 type II toxin-antitoxin system VapC family toxin [Caldilinea sp.]HRA64622.1 type II toxin-antitoxin system VapC family toxin [Caldilinea sp.]